MADGVIDIKMTVESATALAALQREQAELRKVKRELDALKKSWNQGWKQIGGQLAGGVGQAVAALTGIGGAIAAISMIANQLKLEVTNLRSVQSEAGGTQVNFAKSFSQANKNIGGAMDAVAFRQVVIDAAEKAGVDQAKMATIIGAAAAGVGTSNEKEVMQVATAGQKVAQTYLELETPEQGLAALGVTSIKRAAQLDDEEAIGLGLMGAAQHKSDTTGKFVTNVLADVPKLMKLDMSAQQAMGVLSSFSQMMGDTEGTTSGTAAIVTAKELAERYPELPTFESRMQKVQSSPAEYKKYMEGGTYQRGALGPKKFGEAAMGRGDAYTTIRGLMRGDASEVQDLKSRTEAIGGRDKWRAATQQIIADMDRIPEAVLLKTEQMLKATVSGIQLANMSGGAAGVARENLQQILKASGLSDIEQKAALAKFEWESSLGGKMANQEAARQLEAQASVIENPEVDYFGNRVGSGWLTGPAQDIDTSLVTDEDRLKSARLRASAKALRDLDVKGKTAQQSVETEAMLSAGIASTDRNRSPVSRLQLIRDTLAKDTDITSVEASAARANASAATQDAFHTAKGLSAKDQSTLTQEVKALVKAIEALIPAVKGNTEATDQNTKQPTGSPATGRQTTGIVPGKPVTAAHGRTGSLS